MKRAWLLFAAGAVGAALLFSEQAPPRQPGSARDPAPALREPSPVETSLGGARTVALDPGAVAALGAALAARVGRASLIDQALDDARAGRADPVELGRRLRAATAGHPELGSAVLRALAAERSPAVALQLAQVLGTLEDDATLRAETVATLRAGSSESRSTGLIALLGRGEPEVLQLAAATLGADPSAEARASAAFLLNNAPGELPAAALRDALEAARRALSGDDPAGTRLREESATLLGRPAATTADLALLEQCVFHGEPALRMRALAALEQTGEDRALLRSTFDRVAADPAAPERLVEMAKVWRAAH